MIDSALDVAAVWLARAYALYGFGVLLLPSALFLYLGLLVAVVWAAASHARSPAGRSGVPWPSVPAGVRRRGRLAIEIVFGLINPTLYLAIFAPALPGLHPSAVPWSSLMTTTAWVLLAAVWTLRFFGSALGPSSRAVRTVAQATLVAALACVLVYGIKDAWLLFESDWDRFPVSTFVFNVLRVCPLYLIPAVLLWDHLQSTGRSRGFFLLPGRAARVAVASVAAMALVTLAVATHHKSDAAVRSLVADHRDAIRTAAARHDVDPRLIASIVYVTHRDQLSPFRDALERLIVRAWARNLRGEFGVGSPDHIERVGTDENPLLNRSFDISVGVAQIKPRTAQTASVLATGLTPDELPTPAFYAYRDVEPIGDHWASVRASQTAVRAPITVPAARPVVASALLDAQSNLEMCALILALYQRQWETADAGWSLRQRPEILATLYQIGFARSKPHAAPRSNAFGDRVREIHGQSWLRELFGVSVPR